MKPHYHLTFPTPPTGVLSLSPSSARLSLHHLQHHTVLSGPAAQTLALQANWLEEAASLGLKTVILPAISDTTLAHLASALRLQPEWVRTLPVRPERATLSELLSALLRWSEATNPPLLLFIGRGYTAQQHDLIQLAHDLSTAGCCVIADIEPGLLDPAWTNAAQSYILYPPATAQARRALQQPNLPDKACWYCTERGYTLLSEDK